MKPRPLTASALVLLLAAAPLFAAKKPAKPERPATTAAPASVKSDGTIRGWLDWRGPDQNGTSPETGLPDKVDASKPLWSADLPGQSAPVIANGKLYIMGYEGDGPDLQEELACFDAETGKKLWDVRYNDFLSDTVYNRYATSSPTIDPETGRIRSWGFGDDGSHSQSLWSNDGKSWILDMRGVLGDGTPTSEVVVLQRVAADAITWRSTDRVLGDESLPDTKPMRLTRVK